MNTVLLATFLQELHPTLLVDGDLNRSTTNRSKRGKTRSHMAKGQVGETK